MFHHCDEALAAVAHTPFDVVVAAVRPHCSTTELNLRLAPYAWEKHSKAKGKSE